MSTTTANRATKKIVGVSASLKEMRPLVSNELKMLLALELKCTTRTIETYLAGQGKKLPFAVELLGLVEKKLAATV